MKIYTKTGDKGETSLVGGKRVPKYDDRVEAYGTIDELNSHLGLIRDLTEDNNQKEILFAIQNQLFVAASIVASDSEETMRKMPQIRNEDILVLEQMMDKMNEHLPQLKSFILPGGHVLASQSHIARTVCRRAERLSLKIVKTDIAPLNMVTTYLNRLSDFLFVLARHFANINGSGDILWEAKKSKV